MAGTRIMAGMPVACSSGLVIMVGIAMGISAMAGIPAIIRMGFMAIRDRGFTEMVGLAGMAGFLAMAGLARAAAAAHLAAGSMAALRQAVAVAGRRAGLAGVNAGSA